jgi:pyruvate dehydrogenase E2 component (dihydrolipoamide acetyltransferase)
MEEIVTMPKLGLTMTRGTVVTWHKAVGEAVKKGDVICEVETEKITSDVTAPFDGYMKEIIVPAGEERAVLEPICIVAQNA